MVTRVQVKNSAAAAAFNEEEKACDCENGDETATSFLSLAYVRRKRMRQ